MRIKRPRLWTDPRFVLGVVIIAISLGLGSWLLLSQAARTEFYLLRQDVAPGTAITVDMLRVVSGSTGSDSLYVQSGKLPPGAVAVRSMQAGELIPRTALRSGKEESSRRVVVPLVGTLPQGSKVGMTVDLWEVSTGAKSNGKVVPPEAKELVKGAIIFAINEGASSYSQQKMLELELVVPRDEVAKLLVAVGSRTRLMVVPQ